MACDIAWRSKQENVQKQIKKETEREDQTKKIKVD